MSSTGRSEALHYCDDLPLPIEVRGIRGARRLRLRLDPSGRLLKLTGPLRMNRRLALEWAVQQSGWVRAQLDSMLPDEPFVPGAVVPVEGTDIVLNWLEDAPRAPVQDGERLICGGPRSGFARRIELSLKRRALETLSREAREIAAMGRLKIRSVSIGDATTRWGSCSSDGRIRFSWRLILAPVDVRRYVVAHEVAHLAHLDHGHAFKALERQLFGRDTSSARLLLRRLGPRLKRIGRGP